VFLPKPNPMFISNNTRWPTAIKEFSLVFPEFGSSKLHQNATICVQIYTTPYVRNKILIYALTSVPAVQHQCKKPYYTN
jgi:hypothetical protein